MDEERISGRLEINHNRTGICRNGKDEFSAPRSNSESARLKDLSSWLDCAAWSNESSFGLRMTGSILLSFQFCLRWSWRTLDGEQVRDGLKIGGWRLLGPFKLNLWFEMVGEEIRGHSTKSG